MTTDVGRCGFDSSRNEEELTTFLIEQIDDVVRDMASHVGDQIFDVLKRNGMLMRSEAAATVMLIETAVQTLAQAADQCSRAAETDCSDAVIAVFIQLLRDRIASTIEARRAVTTKIGSVHESAVAKPDAQ